MSTSHSPRILSNSWGRLEIDGFGVLKDAKLYPDGARSWDWNETGTRHSPGVQFADVEELLEHGAKVVILSRGRYKQLQVHAETLEALEERGIPTHVLQTEEAITLYNSLRETEPVGALIHSTC